jgi:hypothetical protein
VTHLHTITNQILVKAMEEGADDGEEDILDPSSLTSDASISLQICDLKLGAVVEDLKLFFLLQNPTV